MKEMNFFLHPCAKYIFIYQYQLMLQINYNQKPNLIINADDLGYSQFRDNSIFQLIANKQVTSASILVNGKTFQQAIFKSKQYIFSLGIHLNLTEGKPISGKCNTLIDSEGNFLGKAAFYQKIRNRSQQINHQDIYNEISSQFLLFIKKNKGVPSHFDGHNHIHMIPFIAKIISEIAHELGIYKYRYPYEHLQNKQHAFNFNLVKDCQVSKQFYIQKKMISTSYFIGLQLIFNFSLQKLCQILKNKLKLKQISIQLMVHPGYRNYSCIQDNDFQNSLDREKQKQVLESKQLKQFLVNFNLINWNELECRKQNIKKRILLHSVLKRGTGNHTACLRLKKYLQEMKYEVYLRHIYEGSQLFEKQVKNIENFCIKFKIDLIIGINIYRSGIILKNAFYDQNKICYQVPFFLVIAGTDANIYIKNIAIKHKILEAVTYSVGLISLTSVLTNQFEYHLKQNNIKKQIELIPQSETQTIVKQQQFKDLMRNLDLDFQKPYIIFPASIRPVKDIGFLLKQLNQIIREYNINVYIFGPILDQVYHSNIKSQFSQVKYLGVIDNSKMIILLKNSICLINSSISEGMSNAILQAQINKKIALVRGNAGNKTLVQHMKTGLIFDTPQQFKSLFCWLLQNNNIADSIKQNAFQQSIKKFSKEKQFEKYKTLIGNFFNKNRPVLENNKQKFQINLSPFVHPVSKINNLLFSQIPILNQNSLLDVGCGTGVFALHYLTNNINQKFQIITLSDISYLALGNAYFNLIQNSHIYQNSSKIIIIQSDIFNEIYKNNIKFDVILANMPQTPYYKQKIKLDKNGGLDGIKLNQQLLKDLRQLKNKKLITLYSYMSYPEKYFKLIQQFEYRIVSRSTRQFHRINRQQYDNVLERQSQYLLSLKQRNICEFQIQNQEFIIGTQLLEIHIK